MSEPIARITTVDLYVAAATLRRHYVGESRASWSETTNSARERWVGALRAALDSIGVTIVGTCPTCGHDSKCENEGPGGVA